MSTYCPDLETILFDIMVEHDPEPPAPSVVEAWCARFPHEARGIRSYVRDWIQADLARGRIPLHYRTCAVDNK